MSQLGTVYATKRRRRNGKSLKPPPKDGVTKSNPSKRHRERLNAELDLLASLLPFEQNILSKLDRLSILRLSVSYLRTKSYFQVVMSKDKDENGIIPHIHAHDGYRVRELGTFEHGLLDGDTFLQALNGFLMILTCEGEVFFATHSIESYLGFHQSDIVHQSVYELVHSEDREELQRQLLWNSFLPADMSNMQLAETLAPDKALYLERSFTVRFRCLLDNTSGFLRLDIRGRVKILHGQNRKTEEPPLALFAYCTPFGPPSLLEIPHKENMFKSKHKLDFSLVSMDQRGKHILGYSDAELVNMGGYDLVHYDDLAYVASAHQELLKTGASGMIAYRYQKKDCEWQWLQTSSRLVYKNSKPDFVICTHRQLMDEEGHDLLGKRTMDFKVSYLDTGLASTYFSEADQLVVAPTSAATSPNSLPPPVTPTRPNRRYKTQLRDFLSTCRTKRKMQQQQPQQTSPLGQVTSPAPVVEYLPDSAVAVAAAYSNLNPMYTTSPYATAADNLYMGTSVHSTNFYPVTENLFHQYRLQGVGGYYTDYHHTGTAASPYVTNGFLPYEGYALTAKDDKWQETGKYYSGYSSGYGSPTSTSQQIVLKTPKTSPHVMEVVSCSSDGASPVGITALPVAHVDNCNNNNNSRQQSNGTAVKMDLTPQDPYERQTVLMWGSSSAPLNPPSTRSRRASERSPQATPISTNGLIYNTNNNESDASTGTANNNKWNGDATKEINVKSVSVSTPETYQLQHDDSGLYSNSSVTTSPQQQRLNSNSSSTGGSSSASNVVILPAHNSVTEQTATSNLSTSTHQQQQQQQQQRHQQQLLHHQQPKHQLQSQQQQPHQQTQQQSHLHNHAQHEAFAPLDGGGSTTTTIATATSPAVAVASYHQHHAAPHHHHHHHPHHHGPHHHHHAHHHPHAHHHAHHHHHAAHAHVHHTNTNGNGEQLLQIRYATNQLPSLAVSNRNLTSASASSSPSSSSPNSSTIPQQQQQQQLPAITHMLNGLTTNPHHNSNHHHQIHSHSNHNNNNNNNNNNNLQNELTVDSVTLVDDTIIETTEAVAAAATTSVTKTSTVATTTRALNCNGQYLARCNITPNDYLINVQHQQQEQQQQLHLQQHINFSENGSAIALAYTPNAAYVLNAASLLEHQSHNGSPLLSFSEVTNTLLNQ